MKKITGAIFDLDGTLLDSMPMWLNAGADYLKEAFDVIAEPNLGQKMFRMTMPEAAVYFQETYHVKQSTESLIEGINDFVRRAYEKNIPCKPYVMDFLKLCREQNIPISIATVTTRSAVDAALKRLGIFDWFTGIFSCSDLNISKATPEVYEMARACMRTERETTWVFEDALHAIDPAHEGGFSVVGIYDPASEEAQEEIRDKADVYGRNFQELKEIFF